MLPSALDHIDEIAGARDRSLAIFLDFDGTLTPIVTHPEKALLSDSMRETLRALSARAAVAVLSGRELDEVRQRVGIDSIIYGGSHGFDIAGPRGLRREVATEFLPELDAVEQELRRALAGIRGARLERKRFSVAVHYRKVAESGLPNLEQAFGEIAARHPTLRRMDGKKVHELLPDIEWDKGRAALWLLEALGLQGANAIYIGDDVTDEDAFRALKPRGVGIIVAEQPRPSSARYMLKDPGEVERFLRILTARG